MYLAYTAPHWPLHALPEDIEKLVGVAVIGQIPEIEGTEKNYKYWELANGGTISYETKDNTAKHEEQK